MPSPGGCSSVGDAPSLSFSPLPLGTFAIDFPREEPEEAVRRDCQGHAVTAAPPMARSLAAGHGGPPLWTPHAKEPLRRLVAQPSWGTHGVEKSKNAGVELTALLLGDVLGVMLRCASHGKGLLYAYCVA